MNKLKLNKFILVTTILLISTVNVFSNISIEVLYKINDQIITSVDLENEKKFLIFLNPKLNNLSKNQITKISKESLKNRKIKEIELSKYFDLNKKNDLGKKFINNYVSNTNYTNVKNLKVELKKFNLKYNYFESNFIIDNLWRQFIYNKFKTQVKLDLQQLKNKIQNNSTEIEELNLSEILFEVKSDITFDNLKKKIYSEIDKSGFEAAATIYSISDSKNFGGKLGWIKSNQISDKIYAEIKKNNQLTSPIKTNNGYLIIKVNEKRKVNEEINLEKELKKLINLETEKELNKFGYIYFNKIKKRTFVSEN